MKDERDWNLLGGINGYLSIAMARQYGGASNVTFEQLARAMFESDPRVCDVVSKYCAPPQDTCLVAEDSEIALVQGLYGDKPAPTQIFDACWKRDHLGLASEARARTLRLAMILEARSYPK